MENKSFRKFLEAKSAGANVERRGNSILWNEEIVKDQSFTDFLEFAYSDRKSGEYIYLEKSVALDILDRINWMENKIRILNRRARILLILFIAISLIATWGWLI